MLWYFVIGVYVLIGLIAATISLIGSTFSGKRTTAFEFIKDTFLWIFRLIGR